MSAAGRILSCVASHPLHELNSLQFQTRVQPLTGWLEEWLRSDAVTDRQTLHTSAQLEQERTGQQWLVVALSYSQLSLIKWHLHYTSQIRRWIFKMNWFTLSLICVSIVQQCVAHRWLPPMCFIKISKYSFWKLRSAPGLESWQRRRHSGLSRLSRGKLLLSRRDVWLVTNVCKMFMVCDHKDNIANSSIEIAEG